MNDPGIQRWRKKPIEIDALRLTPTNGLDVSTWCGGQYQPAPNHVLIRTLEGTMQADVGDYVIRGVKGEHYPCKPDIFEASYEPITPPDEDSPVVDEARLRSTTDAMVWAEEFAKVCPDVDQGLMLGWFANAIETAKAT